jgi:3-phosphoshikimate 1-carboxyvinyltransferase
MPRAETLEEWGRDIWICARMLTLPRCAPRGLAVRGAADLRAKESGRIQAIVTNLRWLGMEVEEYPDAFAFQGKESLIHAKCGSFGGHRIAVAFGIAGLTLAGETVIENAECVDISFSTFRSLLERLQMHQP